jgi:hypothetical protein
MILGEQSPNGEKITPATVTILSNTPFGPAGDPAAKRELRFRMESNAYIKRRTMHTGSIMTQLRKDSKLNTE